jgi:cobalt-zinc-cadmium efflux system protein
MHSHHHHDHSHYHSEKRERSFNLAFTVAVTLTVGYTLGEAFYGLKANSMSLLADAAHNLGDSLGLIFAWIANWLLTFPARKRYSYGFKRTTIIAALINAFILVATSTLIAYESIYKLFHLTSTNEITVLIVAFIGILINGGSSLLFRHGASTDLNIRSAFWHLLADALILGGVVISAVIIYYTGWHWVDPTVGLIIVGIVLWGTWGLLRDSLRLILDAVPHYIDYNGVREYLTNYPGVEKIHDLHIWGLSTREVALTVHLIMPNTPLTDTDYKTINNTLHTEFRINHATIQVESGHVDNVCIRSEVC